VQQVRLADGATLPADVVLMAVGARPNDDIAAAAGLRVRTASWSTSMPHRRSGDLRGRRLHALPEPAYGAALRLECVQNAIDQAKAVASEMLGKPQFYDPVPWFWSDQYELKLQMTGISDGYDEALTVGEATHARFSVEYRKNGA